MATKELTALSARNANPFQRIPFQPSDLSAPENGGGGSKELVPVTKEYRAALIGALATAAKKLKPEIAIHPASPGVLIFKLRDNAIAKSHRPNTLAAEAGLQLAGVARIEEMLVAANAASIHALAGVINSRNTKMIRANLSAIDTILAWDQTRRITVPVSELRKRGRALLSLFRFNAADATARNVDALRNLLHRFNVQADELVQRWGPPIFRVEMDAISNEALEVLSAFPGLRSIFPEPRAYSAATIAGVAPGPIPPPIAGVQLPVIGVFDTGASAGATSLQPWISSSEPYVLPPDTDYVHGTAVASLIAGGKSLNGAHAWLPSTPCQIHDVCGLEAAGGNSSDLVIRLSNAIRKAPHVKVWNLSLGAGQIGDHEFSYFAQQLDALSDEHKVLFVVAAGNYLDLPRRGWPASPSLQDRLSSPGDSVRALTVGSIAHLDAPGAMVAAGEPAPYSRRGPGPVFTPKPDLVHAGGGVHSAWNAGASSIQVLATTNAPYGNFGTSFAAPIVSSVAGHVWQSLEGRRNVDVAPHIVKALLIHAARLASPDYSAHERRYYGGGIPKDALSALYDTDDCFTMMFEALVVPGFKWRKTPYPIPASLLHNGKLRAEVIITAVYSPPLDPNSGAEYVRANVSVSFGVLESGKIKGKVPMEGEQGTDGYEAAQIEHGGKWSPVKLHRKQFSQGVAGDQWAIQLEALLRANEPPLAEPMNVALIVSLRSVDGNTQVHADGIRALVASNWVHDQLPVRVPVTV
ncbi:S8 family anti-phage peptidase IteS [Comamonas sp. JNW]|uniref:S8 family anti-phage peptidase IteS n=1 Tax=Comamonas sp. JNW TaxID=2170731 RepID=UPI000DE69352|nr:S8 family anti-phage peptidase IteS [Comamonas sp. JNW]PWB19178.1 peptidase [Comamonas sp. JNW]